MSSGFPSTDVWQQWHAKLEDCEALEEGWNGYSAPPPEKVALENAQMLLKQMQKCGCEPTRIAPSAMGGIAITRKINSKKVLIECYNDGRIFALFSDRTTEELPVKQLDEEEQSLQDFFYEVERFLND